MNKKSKLIALIALLMLIASCGNTKNEPIYAPPGSKIIVNPSSFAATFPTGIVRQDFTVMLLDADGNPLHGKSLDISGFFAYPFNPSLYQMYDKNTNAPLSSPFTAKIDDYGSYKFYILVPATIDWPVAGTPNSFTASVDITSGDATPASISLTIN